MRIFWVVLAGMMHVAPAAFGQDWQLPYKDVNDANRLGGKLEPYFTSMLSECEITSLVYVKDSKREKPERTLSSIPLVLQHTLRLSDRVWSQDRASLARLFAFSFPNSFFNPAGENWGDDSRVIYAGDLLANPASMLPRGTGTVIYSHNCTGVVNAAVQAAGQLAVPAASMKAALKSEYSGSTRQVIALVEGSFNSPLSLALNAPVASRERTNALFTLWDWYRTHTTDLTKPNYYVKSLTGVALYQLSEKARKKDGDFTASGSANSLFASLDANVRAAIVEENSITINKQMTAAYLRADNTPWVDFERLPMPNQLQAQLNALTFQLQPSAATTLFPNQAIVQKQRLSGMPAGLCTADYWSVEPADKKLGKMEIVRVSAVPNGGLAGSTDCEIEVAFTPTSAAFANTQVEVRYSLRTKLPVNGQFLTLAAAPVTYATSRSPQLFDYNYAKRYAATDIGNGDKKLQWEVAVTVSDEEGILDWKQGVTPLNLQLTLPSGMVLPTTATVQLSQDKKAAFITISYNVEASSEYDLTADAFKHDVARITGSLRFFRKADSGNPSAAVERPVPQNFTVDFPKLKEKQVAAQPTPTTGQ